MNGSRSSPPRHGDRSSLDALSRTIEGLEARIEGLMAPSGSRDSRHPAERDLPRPREESRPPRAGAGPSALDEIRQRQRMLDAGRDAPRAPLPRPNERLVSRVVERHENEDRPGQQARRPHDYHLDIRPESAGQRARTAAPQPAGGEAGLRDIAQALVNLRHELKQDISEGVSREIGGLLSEIRSIKSMAGDRRFADDMRGDLARLAEGIGEISRQARPDDAESLRAEFEDLKAMMDNLAREDSVRRMESRWNGVEERLQGLDTGALQEELVSLAYRLDDIKSQLGNVSDSPAIHALEDRMMAIAAAMEQLGKRIEPSDRAIADQFAGIDGRLDEISRAIVASTRSAAPAMDPIFLQRLENRIGALAEQIDEMSAAASSRHDPAEALNARLEALTERIEDLAGERAAGRLEERLDALSTLLETARTPAQQPELTGYLSDISRKIDALDHGLVNDVLAERLDYLARRIDEIDTAPQPVPVIDDSAFRRLESQIGGIAARLDETAGAPSGDHEALRNLEAQIAHLSALISEPHPQAAADLPPQLESRMAAIEDYMATSDEYIIEAARQAAEAVLEAYTRNGGMQGAAPAADLGALTALAEDLRHLEELTRNSEERTHRTFEALHDTLVQIAGRLDSMDRPERHSVEETHDAPAGPGWTEAPSEPAYAFTGERYEDDPSSLTPAAVRRVPAGAEEEYDDFFSAAPVAAQQRAVTDDAYAVGPIIRDAAPAVAEAVPQDDAAPAPQAPPEKTGFLAGLGKRLRPQPKESRTTAETGRAVIDPTPPIAPLDTIEPEGANDLLEPGSGVPDVKKILERVRASQNKGEAPKDGERADYIAAARRAAQAAAREMAPSVQGETAASGKGKAKNKARAEGGASALSRHRRPILLAVGAVLLVIMSMPLVNTLIGGERVPVAEEAALPAIEAPAEPAPEAPGTESQADAAGNAPSPAFSGQGMSTEIPATAAGALPLEPANGAAGVAAAAPDRLDAAISVPGEVEPASLAEAARNGDRLALFEIGARYTEGRGGLATDLSEAAVWYRLSADRGFAPAQYRLANLYEKGTGVAQDAEKAMDYYRKAAEQGNASAMHNLAVMHAAGSAGTVDYEAAVHWFRKAADFGVSDSQFNLAILYARGNGVARDLEESYKWFALAARDGDKDAAQKRDEVANALTPEQLESARVRVGQWQQQPLDDDVNDVTLPDEWAGKGLKTASVDMKKAVRNIQAILNNNGFDSGVPDGEMGPKTVAAIKAFQKSVGQEPDGKITDDLVKELLARNN